MAASSEKQQEIEKQDPISPTPAGAGVGSYEEPISSAPSPPASTRDLDDSYEVYKQNTSIEIDAAESKKVLRKIDRRVLPILFFIYLFQYLDKNSLNFASVYGLKTGTHLHGQQYSWLSSIFYFGYLAAQYPIGYAMQRLPIGKVISAITVAWGAILLTTPACHNFAGVATNRFMLGLTEAGINPGFVLMMSMWYTSSEQPFRLEVYYSTNGIATMVGGLIGYGVGHITTGLPRWMYVFLIFGSISFLFGLISFVFLPDLPSTARFLTPRERGVAVERVAANRQGVKNHHFKRSQAIQTFQDPKTYILFIMAVGAQIPNAALTNFTSIVIESFGFSALGSQYLQIPGGAVQFLALIIGGWIATHYASRGHLRSWTMITANLICIVGAGLLVGLPNSNKWGRLVAIWLCYFQGLGFSLSLTIVSSNVAGYTKKQLTGAALFTGYCVGNIIGPQTFIAAQAPGYHGAYVAMLVGYVVKLAAVVVLYAYMWRENRRRDRDAAVSLHAGGLSTSHLVGAVEKVSEEERRAIEEGMRDRTEIDNKGFRYIL